MKNVMSSLKSGDWRALVACFLYFDTGFTVWVLYGPLAPFISKSVAMTPAQKTDSKNARLRRMDLDFVIVFIKRSPFY